MHEHSIVEHRCLVNDVCHKFIHDLCLDHQANKIEA